MKYFYITCFDEIYDDSDCAKHFAYVLRVSESRNIVNVLSSSTASYLSRDGKTRCPARRIAGNIFPTRKKAVEVCVSWNHGFLDNGTIFDPQYCFDLVYDRL